MWLERLINISPYSKLEVSKKLGYKSYSSLSKYYKDPLLLKIKQRNILAKLFKVKPEILDQLINEKITLDTLLKTKIK